ncbi:MAG: hypothetical protein GXX03_12360 [Bacteroidales bacterium]|nr:hypothetical protein [Bacteroidales bacterium]
MEQGRHAADKVTVETGGDGYVKVGRPAVAADIGHGCRVHRYKFGSLHAVEVDFVAFAPPHLHLVRFGVFGKRQAGDRLADGGSYCDYFTSFVGIGLFRRNNIVALGTTCCREGNDCEYNQYFFHFNSFFK